MYLNLVENVKLQMYAFKIRILYYLFQCINV